jgi:hypothetical protein
MAIDFTTAEGQVRLLINDVNEARLIFADAEITAFLLLEGSNVKRAAAQAVDTIADNEALASKVITDHQLQTDGAKLADALRKRAKALRDQADVEDEDGDGFFFGIVEAEAPGRPELTSWPFV